MDKFGHHRRLVSKIYEALDKRKRRSCIKKKCTLAMELKSTDRINSLAKRITDKNYIIEVKIEIRLKRENIEREHKFIEPIKINKKFDFSYGKLISGILHS